MSSLILILNSLKFWLLICRILNLLIASAAITAATAVLRLFSDLKDHIADYCDYDEVEEVFEKSVVAAFFGLFLIPTFRRFRTLLLLNLSPTADRRTFSMLGSLLFLKNPLFHILLY